MTPTNHVDDFLAECVRAAVYGTRLPKWPGNLTIDEGAFVSRLYFHGICLLLVGRFEDFPDWPRQAVAEMRREARLQAMWEASHASAIAPLLDALDEAGISALLMKGTALAYSVYPDPAVRRRGDTDLLIEGQSRSKVRDVFEKCGFIRDREVTPTQDAWTLQTDAGFIHEIDLHWSISGSVAISEALKGLASYEQPVRLVRLSKGAKSLGHGANLILACINRKAHLSFGYNIEDGIEYDGDRLIWAVDMDRLSASFSNGDWQTVIRMAGSGSAADLVKNGLQFAQRALKTEIPDHVLQALASEPDQPGFIGRYYETLSSKERMLAELRAATTNSLKFRILMHHLFPGRKVLKARYPNEGHWPLFALRLRRLIDAGAGLLLSK